MLTPTEAYQYDPTFRRVVDLMCAYLSEYEITPAELRQAAILAATMHEARRIKPLIITIPPAVFGALVTEEELNRTVSGSMFNLQGCESGRIQSAVPNFTEQDKQAGLDNHRNWVYHHPKSTPQCDEHCHIFRASGYGYEVCYDCGMSDVYYNWAYNKK